MNEFPRWSFPKFNELGRLPNIDIVLRDITLREGEQTADFALNEEEKLDLAMGLSESGIHQIQCGYSPDDVGVLRKLKERGCKSLLEIMCVGYAKNWEQQVTAAVESGADIVHFIFRSDDEHLRDLGIDRATAIQTVVKIASFAKSNGAKQISFGPSFASKADTSFLIELVNSAIGAGVNQIVVSDSTGVMNPEGFGGLISLVGKNCKARIAVHCHDDFGLALANTLQGVRSGATIIECSIGGLGERAGNAATEEVALALKLLYNVNLNIDLTKLASVAQSTFKVSKLPIPSLKPVFGRNSFTQKLDIHVMTTRTRPWLHEPYDPNVVGMTRKLVVGKRSGPIAVREKARELSLAIPEERIETIVRKVNEFADKNKRAMTDSEFVQLVENQR